MKARITILSLFLLMSFFEFGCTAKYSKDTMGEIPNDSPFADVELGMGMTQVYRILGPPTDKEVINTGKMFIPLYLGSDAMRERFYYRGLGYIDFGIGVFQGTPIVNNIVYEDDGAAFQGAFGRVGKDFTRGSKIDTDIFKQYKGTWEGVQKHVDKSIEDTDLFVTISENKITWDLKSEVCSGNLELLGVEEGNAYFISKLDNDPGLNCLVYNLAKVTKENNNTLSYVVYSLTGKMLSKTSMSRSR